MIRPKYEDERRNKWWSLDVLRPFEIKSGNDSMVTILVAGSEYRLRINMLINYACIPL
jgi:hypothetical protein